jgi:hypothetical protein
MVHTRKLRLRGRALAGSAWPRRRIHRAIRKLFASEAALSVRYGDTLGVARGFAEFAHAAWAEADDLSVPDNHGAIGLITRAHRCVLQAERSG